MCTSNVQEHTDYKNWMLADHGEELEPAYEVFWKDPWEPFYIGHISVPDYDERFRQYGFNRISQVRPIHAAILSSYFRNYLDCEKHIIHRCVSCMLQDTVSQSSAMHFLSIEVSSTGHHFIPPKMKSKNIIESYIEHSKAPLNSNIQTHLGDVTDAYSSIIYHSNYLKEYV